MKIKYLKYSVLLATVVCVLGACASGQREIRLEPPSLQIENLRIDGGIVHFRLLLHNRNDHVLYLSEANITMRIDETDLFDAAWRLDLDMSPRGRELISLDAPALTVAAERLLANAGRGAAGVPFELSSEIVIEGQKKAEIEHTGFLHPVPGQPGEFR